MGQAQAISPAHSPGTQERGDQFLRQNPSSIATDCRSTNDGIIITALRTSHGPPNHCFTRGMGHRVRRIRHFRIPSADVATPKEYKRATTTDGQPGSHVYRSSRKSSREIATRLGTTRKRFVRFAPCRRIFLVVMATRKRRAETTANRLWKRLLDTGLHKPVDDYRTYVKARF